MGLNDRPFDSDRAFWFRQKQEQERDRKRREAGVLLLELFKNPKNEEEHTLLRDLVDEMRKLISPHPQGGRE